MHCLITPCWSIRPPHATQHGDNKRTRTNATATPPPFLRASQPINTWRAWKYQQGVGSCELGNEMEYHTLTIKIFHTPSSKPIGHHLARLSRVRLNNVRTGYDRCNANTRTRWNCRHRHRVSAALQTRPHKAHHIASECPLHTCNWDLPRNLHCVVGENPQSNAIRSTD